MSWPYQPLMPASAQLEAGVGGPTYNIAAGAAFVALAGGAMQPVPAWRFAVSRGAYSVSEQTAEFRAGRKLAAETGSLVLAGQVIAFSSAQTLDAAIGAVSVTGSNVQIRAAYRIPLETAAFSAAGHDVDISSPAFNLPATRSEFSLAGQDATPRLTRRVSASCGAFALEGEDAVPSVGGAASSPSQPRRLGLSLSL